MWTNIDTNVTSLRGRFVCTFKCWLVYILLFWHSMIIHSLVSYCLETQIWWSSSFLCYLNFYYLKYNRSSFSVSKAIKDSKRARPLRWGYRDGTLHAPDRLPNCHRPCQSSAWMARIGHRVWGSLRVAVISTHDSSKTERRGKKKDRYKCRLKDRATNKTKPTSTKQKEGLTTSDLRTMGGRMVSPDQAC